MICNVQNGKSWAIISGYSGDNIIVNDPFYETSSYLITDIVDGQNGVYRPSEKKVSIKKE